MKTYEKIEMNPKAANIFLTGKFVSAYASPAKSKAFSASIKNG